MDLTQIQTGEHYIAPNGDIVEFTEMKGSDYHFKGVNDKTQQYAWSQASIKQFGFQFKKIAKYNKHWE